MKKNLDCDALRMVDLFAKGDLHDAVSLAIDLANKGDATGMEYLGHAYSQGMAVRKSIETGTRWYKQAWVASGQAHLCINIAVNYARSGNRRRARFWYTRAVSLGDGDAAIEFAEYLIDNGTSPLGDEVRRLVSEALCCDGISEDGRDRAKELQRALTHGGRT